MVTIDEMPMITGDAGSVPFSFLPIEGIAGVEVIKSAGSVLYGSSALNGVINLKSSPITTKPSANVSLFYGVYDIPESLKISPKTKTIYGFNGIYSEKIKQHADQLYSVLDSNGLKHRGELLYLGYNAPWDVTNRRNEVAVELVDFK